ncbi:hypothetical protein NQZ68_016666 [Dissostichus eleginoides]|nr:hypothetical protein NQZ68_016666 [Dissostichus eleginoides]
MEEGHPGTRVLGNGLSAVLGHIVRLYGHTNSVHSAGLKVQTFLWLALGASSAKRKLLAV